jgi:hypothetical protein
VTKRCECDADDYDDVHDAAAADDDDHHHHHDHDRNYNWKNQLIKSMGQRHP